jgi:hypothetical protein
LLPGTIYRDYAKSIETFLKIKNLIAVTLLYTKDFRFLMPAPLPVPGEKNLTNLCEFDFLEKLKWDHLSLYPGSK